MSAPDTDIERQERHHWGSLMGIGISVLFGALIGALITFTAVGNGGEPRTVNKQIDDRTGQVEQKSTDVTPAPEPTIQGTQASSGQ